MNKWIQYTSLFVILACCISAHSQPAAIQIRIDPSFAQSSDLLASDYYEEVEFIPLETTKDVAISSVGQLIVTAQHYIIGGFVRKEWKVFIFNKDGSFYAKIDPEPYQRELTWDQERNQIVLTRGFKAYYYNMEGKLVDQVPLIKGDVLKTNFGNGYSARIRYNVSFKHLPDSSDHEIKLYKNDKIYAKYLPYNQKFTELQTMDWSTWYGYNTVMTTGIDSVVRYVRPYDYSIYRVSPSSFYKEFEFVLPKEMTFSPSLLTDTTTYKKGNKVLYFDDYPDAVQQIRSPYLLGKCLFFRFMQGKFMWDTFMYNLESGTLAKISAISGDSLTYYLPVTDAGMETSIFMNYSFYSTDGKSVYAILPATIALNKMKEDANKNIRYPDHLKRFQKRNKRSDNPIIVRIKPKQAF